MTKKKSNIILWVAVAAILGMGYYLYSNPASNDIYKNFQACYSQYAMTKCTDIGTATNCVGDSVSNIAQCAKASTVEVKNFICALPSHMKIPVNASRWGSC